MSRKLARSSSVCLWRKARYHLWIFAAARFCSWSIWFFVDSYYFVLIWTMRLARMRYISTRERRLLPIFKLAWIFCTVLMVALSTGRGIVCANFCCSSISTVFAYSGCRSESSACIVAFSNSGDFSADERSECIFDMVLKNWRLFGSICMYWSVPSRSSSVWSLLSL